MPFPTPLRDGLPGMIRLPKVRYYHSLSALSAVALLIVSSGCQTAPPPVSMDQPSQRDIASSANKQFLSQASYDPWVLSSTDQSNPISGYMATSGVGYLIGPDGKVVHKISGQKYVGNSYAAQSPDSPADDPLAIGAGGPYKQQLNLYKGQFTTTLPSGTLQSPSAAVEVNWPSLWDKSDLKIDGDPQAQQVIHANLFYLISSVAAGKDRSVAPMGLSSVVYNGHIFWDADVWMLPALIAQYPEYAKSIVDYRFQRLAQAQKNAGEHHFAGAEYPWESAETGEEVAPAEFARERHITADVAFAAWQYYLWTGDKSYLKTEGWPILKATADYWLSRVERSHDGSYHVLQVLSPDETTGLVDDDAYTNSAVRYNLNAATEASKELGLPPNPTWQSVSAGMTIPFDKKLGIPAENSTPLTDRFQAKQADTLLEIFPMDQHYSPEIEEKTLNFYAAHTMAAGPAMTSCIASVVAARLGRGAQSLSAFRDSYQPFMRAPWDAFSEKRTTNNCYFLTGMAGSLQSVLYGFAGLQTAYGSEQASGKLIAKDGNVRLYADPHLPPGWNAITLVGVKFHGKTMTVHIGTGNSVSVT